MMLPMQNVRSIREYFIYALERSEFVQDKTGVKTIEVVGAQFLADEPAIFGTVNEEYIKNELLWYKSMSRYVDDIPGGPPKIWRQVCSTTGLINSNYGWCIWHEDNWNQYKCCLKQLHYFFNDRGSI